MQLILADGNSAVAQAQRLVERSAAEQIEAKRTAIIKLIEMILIYKFPRLSGAEIENRFGFSELKQTKVYQEALQEGETILILRLLSRRIGDIPAET